MGRKKMTRSQRQRAKRERRSKLWMGIIIIALMVLSSLAFIMVYYAPTSTDPNAPAGLDYEIVDNQIIVEVEDGKQVAFGSFPNEGIEVPSQVVPLLRDAVIVVTAFDPSDESNLPYVEAVRFDLARHIPAAQAAMTLSESDLYDLPVGSCADATAEAPIVQLINGSQRITVEGSCITLAAQQQGLFLLRDQLLYEYYDLR